MKIPNTILKAMRQMVEPREIGKVVSVIRSSKHAGGHRRPRGWHQKLRARRKAKHAARRAQRGRR